MHMRIDEARQDKFSRGVDVDLSSQGLVRRSNCLDDPIGEADIGGLDPCRPHQTSLADDQVKHHPCLACAARGLDSLPTHTIVAVYRKCPRRRLTIEPVQSATISIDDPLVE